MSDRGSRVLLATDRPARSVTPSSRTQLVPLPTWPLAGLLLAFPLWWVLGLGDFVFLFAAVPMAVALARRGGVVAPRGFGLWLLFLGVVLVSALTLPADAPFAAEGGLGGRTMTYGYRLAWYLAATVVLLYVGNSRQRDLPFERVSRWLAVMFVITAAGGLLGVLAPDLQFHSPVEALLPDALSSNKFLHTLVHPATADVQDVLGYDQPRPRAPFAYANSWGANLSFFLPFFLYSWCRPAAGWRRWAAGPVLLMALVPVIYSLNRGLWAVLLVGALYGLVQFVRLRGRRVLLLVAPLLAGAAVVAALSPLAGVVQERLENPHSDARRSQLANQTVTSVLTGSPLIGFGNVRDVQGSFASIAGGATPDCSGCGVPPLGTQGHAWLVIFSQGVAGAVLFFGFVLTRVCRHVRSRHPMSVAGVAVVIFFLLETLVYDTLGTPLFTLMIALGLMWRADRGPAAEAA